MAVYGCVVLRRGIAMTVYGCVVLQFPQPRQISLCGKLFKNSGGYMELFLKKIDDFKGSQDEIRPCFL